MAEEQALLRMRSKASPTDLTDLTPWPGKMVASILQTMCLPPSRARRESAGTRFQGHARPGTAVLAYERRAPSGGAVASRYESSKRTRYRARADNLGPLHRNQVLFHHLPV